MDNDHIYIIILLLVGVKFRPIIAKGNGAKKEEHLTTCISQ
jgi:hypothetical protein